ncbi:MAG: hypothetical protein C4519_28390 [Desulfobacteraceae bacterium]|nr:MAG: hypothetical protein C4519_28390 [Desulfobacteraceae bacterium]
MDAAVDLGRSHFIRSCGYLSIDQNPGKGFRFDTSCSFIAADRSAWISASEKHYKWPSDRAADKGVS